ncbi:MAG: ABC transporter substrate-binding protein [Spirochaetaceae bacterium]|jgi:iron complex transport system substrate-binding protein|nr:ABC transporter substrate-binding protein [Spirochaetaceae bacterium]
MKKRFLALALLFAGVLTVNAVGKKETPREAAGTLIFTDSAGRAVEIPENITRIVPSGALAQMFLAAVAPDMICAIPSAYGSYEMGFLPPYFAALPVVGQFYGAANLNPEEIARIGPDLVIDVGEPKDTIAEDMDNISATIGIPTVHITATLRTTPEAFRTLGRLLGRTEQGGRLARFCEKTLAAADELMAKVGSRKKSVLYCQGKAGLNVLARGTFHTEILDWMTDNKAVVDNPASRGSGNEANFEQILLWDPQVILFGPGSVYGEAANDLAWRELRAVKSGEYYEIPSGPYNWMGSPPSINRYLGMIWLGKVLYPQYAAYDLYAETAEYYRLFYDHDLTREQFETLTRNSLPGGENGVSVR